MVTGLSFFWVDMVLKRIKVMAPALEERIIADARPTRVNSARIGRHSSRALVPRGRWQIGGGNAEALGTSSNAAHHLALDTPGLDLDHLAAHNVIEGSEPIGLGLEVVKADVVARTVVSVTAGEWVIRRVTHHESTVSAPLNSSSHQTPRRTVLMTGIRRL